MPCYYPLHGFRAKTRNKSGKRSIAFNPSHGFRDLPVTVPCGQCIGCKLERSRQWAVRCVHEARMHEKNAFLTLTYKPEALPRYGSLFPKHLVDFMKRYRFWLNEDYQQKIRFFACGEYGEQFSRPHYHVLIFGHDFHDKKHLTTVNGNDLFTSRKLEDLWTHGLCTIGDATFESAAYVARYVTKKITGEKALDHYNQINHQTGEILSERIPEFVTMSRRPGVGKLWFDRFTKDVYPSDEVIIRGKRFKPPKYYNTQYEKLFPDDYAKIKAARISAAKNIPELEKTWERLQVKETIQKQRFEQLKRNYE